MAKTDFETVRLGADKLRTENDSLPTNQLRILLTEYVESHGWNCEDFRKSLAEYENNQILQTIDPISDDDEDWY